MITRRGLMGALTGVALVPFWKRRKKVTWEKFQDVELEQVRELLDEFRGRYLCRGEETYWSVYRLPNYHRVYVLAVDAVSPSREGKFPVKMVLFDRMELFHSKNPREGIRKRLARKDREQWEMTGLYEYTQLHHEEHGEFEF